MCYSYQSPLASGTKRADAWSFTSRRCALLYVRTFISLWRFLPNQPFARSLEEKLSVYLIRKILTHVPKCSSYNIKLSVRREKTQLWKCNWYLKKTFWALQPGIYIHTHTYTLSLLRLHKKAKYCDAVPIRQQKNDDTPYIKFISKKFSHISKITVADYINSHFINKWEDNIKTGVKEIVFGCELETSEKAQRLEVASSEYGNLRIPQNMENVWTTWWAINFSIRIHLRGDGKSSWKIWKQHSKSMWHKARSVRNPRSVYNISVATRHTKRLLGMSRHRLLGQC